MGSRSGHYKIARLFITCNGTRSQGCCCEKLIIPSSSQATQCTGGLEAIERFYLLIIILVKHGKIELSLDLISPLFPSHAWELKWKRSPFSLLCRQVRQGEHSLKDLNRGMRVNDIWRAMMIVFLSRCQDSIPERHGLSRNDSIADHNGNLHFIQQTFTECQALRWLEKPESGTLIVPPLWSRAKRTSSLSLILAAAFYMISCPPSLLHIPP